MQGKRGSGVAASRNRQMCSPNPALPWPRKPNPPSADSLTSMRIQAGVVRT